MADSSAVLIIRDGNSATQTFVANKDPSNNLIPHHVLRIQGAEVGPSNPIPVITEINGAAVSSANPLPVAPSPTPMASVFSNVLEAAHVLKAGAGTLYTLQANATISGWILLFDANAIPADGAVAPRKAWQISAAAGQTIDKAFSPPLAMTAGAVVVFSTAASPFQKASAANAYFSAEIA